MVRTRDLGRCSSLGDTSFLIAYADHVAIIVWNGEERSELKLSSHEKKVKIFRRPAAEIEGLVVATRLIFVEMWHKETSGFHLPIREVTITLDDVASLLHLPITGAFHSFETLHVDKVVLMLVELLEVSADEAGAEIVQCHGAYV
ncbi:Protein MAIN-LIKE 1 [Glycine max]|nr:Protein MAIN-LIKE 1 [Glycine max]